MIIAIDFDGTIVEDRYPEIGPELPFATDALRMLMQDHHRLILWTVREGKYLQEAIDWCHERGVDFWAINKDYPEENISNNNHFSRKIKADIFIDDRNIGGLPGWGEIYKMIKEHKDYETILLESRSSLRNEEAPKKKHHWWNF